MEENKLSNIINDYFEESSYYSLYNFDIWITIVIISFVLIIVIYFFSINALENQKIYFEKNKCNPLFMPLASTINPENTDDSFNFKNYQQCLNDLNYEVATRATSPFHGIFNSIMNFFNYLGILVSQFISFLTYLLGILYKLYDVVINRLKFILSSINEVFINIGDFFNNILGIITNIYYLIITLIDSLKYIFAVISLTFFYVALLPSIITSTVAYVTTVSSFIIFLIAMWIPFFGYAVFFSIFIGNLVLLLFALLVTGILAYISITLSNFLKDSGGDTPPMPPPEEDDEEPPPLSRTPPDVPPPEPPIPEDFGYEEQPEPLLSIIDDINYQVDFSTLID